MVLKLKAVVAATLLATTSLSHAQTKEIEVAARTFKFIEGVPSGSATLGIVTDGSGPSQAQADAIAGALAGGKAMGSVTLNPKVIGPDGVGGVDIVFVTDGMAGQHAAIGSAAKGAKRLAFSTDMACVEAGHCTMGVKAEPTVKIVVSRGAADASGLTLNQALKMMIEERD